MEGDPTVENDDLVYNFSTANLSSDGNDTEGYHPYHERPETYLVPILFSIIFIIGVLGNGTLIITFIMHRNLRNTPNMFIVSLAIGDLLVILFCVPFTSTLYTMDSWPYGEVICKFSEFIKDISIGVSVFTLTALSADRYFAIVDPMRKLAGRNATRITCITIAGIWLLSLALALPSILFTFVKEFHIPDRIILVCYPFPDYLGEAYPRVVVLLKFLIYYAIPLCLIAFFYIFMARHLYESTRNMPGESQSDTAPQLLARKKVSKMVLAIIVIFALCFAPTHIYLLCFYYDPYFDYNAVWHTVKILGFCLGFVNSILNPITLYCLSTTFRKYFNQHLLCCLDSNPETQGQTGRGRRRRRFRGWGRRGSYELEDFGAGRSPGRSERRGTLNGRSTMATSITTNTNVNALTPVGTRHPSLATSGLPQLNINDLPHQESPEEVTEPDELIAIPLVEH